MGEILTDCPFRLCSTFVIPIVEQAVATDDELTLQRIPQHPLGGHEEFGLCPASLMQLPLTAYMSEQLEAQAAALERIISERGEAYEQGVLDQPEHSKTPHPSPLGRGPFFTSQTAPDTSQKGGAVATVQQVKGELTAVRDLVAEARLQATVASNKLLDAIAVINVLRETSINSVGGPPVQGALDALAQVKDLCSIAIEEVTTYGATL